MNEKNLPSEHAEAEDIPGLLEAAAPGRDVGDENAQRIAQWRQSVEQGPESLGPDAVVCP
jgi:hypothetical protein